MTAKNAIVGNGRSVHAMRPDVEAHLSYEYIKCGAGWTNAGGRMVSSKIYLTDHEVTCKRCKKILAQEAAATAATAATVAAPKLTKAQSASLALVAAGKVSYRPGRTNGASSGWTRYSYSAASTGAKPARRTKSVNALVELGLANLAGSSSANCPVVLTEAGRKLMGVEATPVAACLVRQGSRIITANGTRALVSGYFNEGGKAGFRLRLDGGLYFDEYVSPYEAVQVLS